MTGHTRAAEVTFGPARTDTLGTVSFTRILARGFSLLSSNFRYFIHLVYLVLFRAMGVHRCSLSWFSCLLCRPGQGVNLRFSTSTVLPSELWPLRHQSGSVHLQHWGLTRCDTLAIYFGVKYGDFLCGDRYWNGKCCKVTFQFHQKVSTWLIFAKIIYLGM